MHLPPLRPSFLLLLLAAAVTAGVTGAAIRDGLAAQRQLDADVGAARAGTGTLAAAYTRWHEQDRRDVWLGVCGIAAGAALGFAAAKLHDDEIAASEDAFELASAAAAAVLSTSVPSRPAATPAPLPTGAESAAA